MTPRIWLGIGISFLAVLLALRFFAPEMVLGRGLVWMMLSFACALCFPLAAAKYCGLRYSALSLERLVVLAGFLSFYLLLDAVLIDDQKSPNALYLVVWFIGLAAYHYFRYRKGDRVDGP